jgi:hypothetical protein
MLDDSESRHTLDIGDDGTAVADINASETDALLSAQTPSPILTPHELSTQKLVLIFASSWVSFCTSICDTY